MAHITHGVHRWAAAALIASSLLAGSACSSAAPDAPAPAPSTATPEATGSAAPGPSGMPSSTLPPPATTPVPQPTPGDVSSTVPTTPQKTQEPVDLDESSKAGGGVTARISDVRSIDAKATGPGEVSGPAVALTVRITNGASEQLSLEQVVVTLTGSDDAPGAPMAGPPARALNGSLGAGKSASGVYVFAVPEESRDPITVDVTVTGGDTVLVFQGKA